MHVHGSHIIYEAVETSHQVTAVFSEGADWKNRIDWALRLNAEGVIAMNESDRATINAIRLHATVANPWTAQRPEDAWRNRTIRFTICKPESAQLANFMDGCFCEISHGPAASRRMPAHRSVPLELLAEEDQTRSHVDPVERHER